MTYEIINGTKEENRLIKDVLNYISDNFFDKLNVYKLRRIEVVDELENGSGGRAIRDKIILPRKNGLDRIQCSENIRANKENDAGLRSLISIVYHELWHVDTWEKYESMYEYVLSVEKKDMRLSYAYMYWIEYLANKYTVFMDDIKEIKEFCEKVIYMKWNDVDFDYSYFIKSLPYFLIESQYLNIYDKLLKHLRIDLRNVVLEFDKMSKYLLFNEEMDDMEKASNIKELIIKFES